MFASMSITEQPDKVNGSIPRRIFAMGLFILWLGIVLYLAFHYVVGRDDVRALSLALQGTDVYAMLKGLHGEGHPAIWYLLLRGAHALDQKPQVLQILSIIVASAATLLLLWQSPFKWPVIALILAGHFSLIEYSVIPRNYGIAMLLLFAFAAIYERHRKRDYWLGLMLLFLANCHLLSMLLVPSLLLLWLVDILCNERAERRVAFNFFLINVAIAALGVGVCLLTTLPTFNDAARVERPSGITLKLLLSAVFLPAAQFRDLILPGYTKLAEGKLAILLSLIMFGSTLGLIRRIGAFVAALASLVGLSMFFALISPGAYRHEALWLVMMVAMYWLATAKGTQEDLVLPARLRSFVGPVSLIGSILFLLILLLQVPVSIRQLVRTFQNGPPYSRSRDLGTLVKSNPNLQEAIIIGDPDFLVEPLSYYIPNQTYLIREQRYGNVVHFTRNARLQISLSDILQNAQTLHTQTGRQVIILLEDRLNAGDSPHVDKEGYDWKLTITPDEVRTFQRSTHLIASFGPVSYDETFDVYTLN